MNHRDARVALREAQRWHTEGLLDDAAFAKIKAGYERDLKQPDSSASAATAIYGAAGVLLGAACLALVVLMDVSERTGSVLWLLLGLTMATIGGLLAWRGQNDLADAFLVGALMPLTAMSMNWVDPLNGLILLSVAAPVAVLLVRPGRILSPMAATVAYLLASFVAIDRVKPPGSEDGLWAIAATLWLAGLLGLNLWRRSTVPLAVMAVATVGLTPAYLTYIFEDIRPPIQGGAELLLGAAMLAILLAGLGLRERGMVIGAAIVLAVDAIVFAFDVGGLGLGMTVLIGTAIALLVLATTVVRRPPEASG